MRISGKTGDVVQLFHVSRADTEREYRSTCVFQETGGGSWVTTVAEAVSDQEHHFARRFAAFFENCLRNSGRLNVNFSFRIRSLLFVIFRLNRDSGKKWVKK